MPTDASPTSRLPGTYVLVFRLSTPTRIRVGRLGASTYPDGWYAYVGSAMRGIEQRLRHHFRPHLRPHWHIDYLLPHGSLAATVMTPSSKRLECALAAALAQRFVLVPHFGSSDCRCPGHLLHSKTFEPLARATLHAARASGCEPVVLHFRSHEVPQLLEAIRKRSF